MPILFSSSTLVGRMGAGVSTRGFAGATETGSAATDDDGGGAGAVEAAGGVALQPPAARAAINASIVMSGVLSLSRCIHSSFVFVFTTNGAASITPALAATP